MFRVTVLHVTRLTLLSDTAHFLTVFIQIMFLSTNMFKQQCIFSSSF